MTSIASGAYKYVKVLLRSLDIQKAMRQALTTHAVQIENLNLGQLLQGIDSRGKQILPLYAPYTVQKKIAKGQPYNRVTLRDTGDFYESVYVEIFKNSFELEATDVKTKSLKLKYGKSILGLTDENIKQVAKIIKPTLEKLLLEQIRQLRNAPKKAATA